MTSEIVGEMPYMKFLERKAVTVPERGLRKIPELHPGMFPHQLATTEFLLRVGAGAALTGSGGSDGSG